MPRATSDQREGPLTEMMLTLSNALSMDLRYPYSHWPRRRRRRGLEQRNGLRKTKLRNWKRTAVSGRLLLDDNGYCGSQTWPKRELTMVSISYSRVLVGRMGEWENGRTIVNSPPETDDGESMWLNDDDSSLRLSRQERPILRVFHTQSGYELECRWSGG